MKKQIIKRCGLGFVLGIVIGQLFSIIISVIWGNGSYYPCALELIEKMNSEIAAVIYQTFLSGCLGAGFGLCSLIWEKESWSLIRQTGVYFIAVMLIMMPVAYLLYWMDHTLQGALSYFLIFVMIFAGIWIIEFIKMRFAVKKMNEKIRHLN